MVLKTGEKMNKKDFFVRENDVVELEVFGQKFKYKKVTADDELDWLEDYQEIYTEKVDGKTVTKIKQNKKKLGKCKFRNIMEVPFTQEELKSFCGIDKPYSEYTNEDKDLLFGKLNPSVFNELIKKINNINQHQKKS